MPVRMQNLVALTAFAVAATVGLRSWISIEQMQLMTFNGEAWEVFGDIITGEVGVTGEVGHWRIRHHRVVPYPPPSLSRNIRLHE